MLNVDLAQEQEQQHPSCLCTILWRGINAELCGQDLMPSSASGPSPGKHQNPITPVCLLNCIKQLLLQLFVSLVGREIQMVKAGETAEAMNNTTIPILLPTAGSSPASAAHSSCQKIHSQEQQLCPLGTWVDGTESAQGPVQPHRGCSLLSPHAPNRAEEK